MQLTLVPHYGLYYYEYETHCTITCSDLNSVMYPQLNVIQSVLFTPHFLACPQSSLPDPLPFAALITYFYFSITLIARYCLLLDCTANGRERVAPLDRRCGLRVRGRARDGWVAHLKRANCPRTAGLVIDSLYQISSGFKNGRGGWAN